MQSPDSENSQQANFDSALPACGAVAVVVSVLLAPLAFAVLEWRASDSLSVSPIENLKWAGVVALCFAPVNLATTLMRARNLWRAKGASPVPSISSPMISLFLAGAGGFVVAMIYNASSQASEDWTDLAIGMATVVFGALNSVLWIAGDFALKKIIQRTAS